MSLPIPSIPVVSGVKNFFTQGWPRFVVFGLLLLAIGYGAGRFATPSKIVTKTQVVTQVVTKVETQVVYQDRVVYKEAKETDKAKDTDTVTTTVVDKKPNGEAVTTTTTEVKVHTDAKTTDQVASQQTTNQTTNTVADKTATKTATSEKTVTYDKPNWLVSPMIGINLGFIGGKFDGSSIEYGGSVEHRFIGPVYLGVWGVTNGSFPGSVIGIKGTIQF